MDATAANSSLGRLYLGTVLAWAVLELAARGTGSTLGQAGLLVGTLAVGATALADQFFQRGGRGSVRAVLAEIGLGRPAATGVAAAAGLALLMLIFYPAFASATGTPMAMRDGWAWLVPGLFVQGGIGEETLYRGYLFGHLQRTRPFWRAALLSLPPFVVVHLLLFTQMPIPVATMATLLSVVMTFPLARLYQLGGGTIWAPALVHAVAQGSIKLVVVPEGQQMWLGVTWMGVCLIVPWLAFAVPARSGARAIAAP